VRLDTHREEEMTISIDKQFHVNELRICGTLNVPIGEWHAPFAHYNATKGKGHECPNCKIGFWGKSSGRISCPSCDFSFIIKA